MVGSLRRCSLNGGGGLIAIVVATIERDKGPQANPSVAVSGAPAPTKSSASEPSGPSVPEQARQAVTIRSEYEKLNTAISSGNAASVETARKTLVKILTADKIPFESGDSALGLLEVFKQAIIAAADDNAKLQTLDAAVKSAASQ